MYKYTLIRVYTKFGGLESHVQCTLIDTMLYNAKERESVINRCRATQCRVAIVINQKNIVLKKQITSENCSLRRRPSDWLQKYNVSKSHIGVHELISYTCKSRIRSLEL